MVAASVWMILSRLRTFMRIVPAENESNIELLQSSSLEMFCSPFGYIACTTPRQNSEGIRISKIYSITGC